MTWENARAPTVPMFMDASEPENEPAKAAFLKDPPESMGGTLVGAALVVGLLGSLMLSA